MSVERWMPVVGFEGLYEVSDQGRVRSLDRIVATRRKTGLFTRRFPGELKALCRCKRDAYIRVFLCKDGVKSAHTLHALVMAAFEGPPPPGKEICHRDGDAENNRFGNLRYDTRRANREDSRRMDRLAVGERIAQHKLTAEQVRAIRASALPSRALAQIYPVGWRHIRRLKNGELWKHV